jgi:hypothetical protein
VHLSTRESDPGPSPSWRIFTNVVPRVEMSREAAVVEALAESRRDATLLRVLPAVLLKNEADFDWDALLDLARRRKLKDELGMMLELTAEASGRPVTTSGRSRTSVPLPLRAAGDSA